MIDGKRVEALEVLKAHRILQQKVNIKRILELAGATGLIDYEYIAGNVRLEFSCYIHQDNIGKMR